MKSAKLIPLLLFAVALPLSGCRKNPAAGSTNKVRVGYIGITCEAPIYSAVEKGFFKEEGLDVELVKCNWSNYKDTATAKKTSGISLADFIAVLDVKGYGNNAISATYGSELSNFDQNVPIAIAGSAAHHWRPCRKLWRSATCAIF